MDDGLIFIALVYFNRFLFIKNKPRFISSEGFSNLEKRICYQRDVVPIKLRCDSSRQIGKAVWRPFSLNSNFLGRM
jgi:hypothetical protein